MNALIPKQSTDQLLSGYHSSMVKCWNVTPPMFVWVQLQNVKSITWDGGGSVALVWLKEPVPIGVNATVTVLQIYYDDAIPVAGLPLALPPQT